MGVGRGATVQKSADFGRKVATIGTDMSGESNRGRTLERALDIVDFVSGAKGSVRLSEIATGTGLHIATVQRMVNTLIERGYLNGVNGNYTIGSAVLPLARAFTLQDKLTAIAFPLLVSLTQETGLTSSVFVRHGDVRVLTARNNAPQPLRYQLSIGQRMGLAVGGGRILLAYLDAAEQDRLLSELGDGVTYVDGRTESIADVKKALKRARIDGYYLSVNERVQRTVSLSVPILNESKTPDAAITIVAHHDTLDPQEILRYKPLLFDSASSISAVMG